MKRKSARMIWACIGLISTGLGAVGVALPILPTTPFLMLAMFAFARSSKKLNQWFLNTKLYKKHLEGFAAGKGMTVKTKRTIIFTVTVMMTFGFVMMSDVFVGRLLLSLVWIFHLIYFVFVVKTNREQEAA